MADRFEELNELVALMDFELLFRSTGIRETMKSYDDLSIQGCMYYSKSLSSTASSYESKGKIVFYFRFFNGI